MVRHGKSVARCRIALRALFVAVLLSPCAGEAETPVSGIDPTTILPKAVKPAPSLSPPSDQKAESDDDAALRFQLSTVQFTGAHALDEDALRQTWASMAGQMVSIADLRTIARRAEALYARHGYGFVVVVVAPQKVEGGVVRFDVIEGRISDLTVLGSDPAARKQATAAFAPVLGQSPPTAASLEAAFENAQAVPGLAVDGALRRGSGTGGLDLVVHAKREEWRTYANVNNLYPSAVGPFGILFGVDHIGRSLYGNQTSFQAYRSIGPGVQSILRLSHAHGLDASGTKLSVTLFAAWANPFDSRTKVDFATNVKAGRLALSHPLISRFGGNLSVTAALDVSNQTTRVFGATTLSVDKLRIASLSLDGEWRPAMGGHATGSIQIRQGLDILGASKSNDPRLSRPNANPKATIANISIEYETPSFRKMRFDWRVEGQLASDALLQPEQYTIGNLSIGRGYQPGANYGDNALAVASELRFGPFNSPLHSRIEPFMFYDFAKLWTISPGAHQERYIDAAGAGLRLELPNKWHVELSYAVPLRAPLGLGEPVPHGRFLLNLTVGLNGLFKALHHPVSAGAKL